ncbi:NAD(P)/FAD-dependent oxidoreductase [Luteimonas huabeiensis]|uniref:NAD(P)/FAD-dependent oxidoreductase n=1 Tax=Luteimonas huabeiensis TaxID=1244513 RepID=UPI00046795B4|nr:NAD(P)/FAD-dependent oxidoreductase [Luteimonas huabeiensis]
MTRFAVIGSGPMGLRAATALIDAGHNVDVYERDDRIGGMSAHFDFNGLDIERYYHFVCRTDYPLFDLLKRYGLSDRLKWTNTKMGYFYRGKLYKWGSPLALLAFPHLSPIQKIRYALHVMHTKGIRDWSALDKEEAGAWIRKWIGDGAYEVMWRDSFRLKFFEYADNLSASWIGTRIKRIALSRESLFKESLGYLEGGSDLVLDALAGDIQARGGRILLAAPVQEVTTQDGKVTGILSARGWAAYDGVLSTSPIQYVPRMVPTLPEDYRRKIESIENIPVACVILKLRHAISDNFWMNISDSRIEIPGVIEYSNLNPLDGKQHILYAPFYMPKTHPKWKSTDQALIDEVVSYLPMLNSSFDPSWVMATSCHRYEFAQTICPPGFQGALPPMESPIAGFYMADTGYYYPEDRSISESLDVGRRLAEVALR